MRWAFWRKPPPEAPRLFSEVAPGVFVTEERFRLTDMTPYGWQPRGLGGMTAGVRVSPETATGVPAVLATVRRAAQEVGKMRLCVWRGYEPLQSAKVEGAWQARLFAKPNDQQTDFGFFETIEESLDYRGNAFVWKMKNERGRPLELFALHPDQVVPVRERNGRYYQIAVRPGYIDPVGRGDGYYVVGAETILHIRGFGEGGSWLAPSPLELERGGTAIGAALAKIRHESSQYGQGMAPRLGISFPQQVTTQQVREWRELFREQYEGPDNAGKTLALPGGATFTPIGLTMSDAQFVESMQFSLEEVCRIFDVPPSIVWGGGAAGTAAVAPRTPEHEQDRWIRYGLSPRLRRIEAAFAADPDLFPTIGSGAGLYPRFDMAGVIRGDLQTEAAILHERVQDGTLTPDEARAELGLPPHPNGIGKYPIFNPVGGGPNPPGLTPKKPSANGDGPSDTEDAPAESYA